MTSPLSRSLVLSAEQPPAVGVKFAFHERQADGSHPFAELLRISARVSVRDLLPAGWTLERSTASSLGVFALASGADGVALIEVWPETATVHVASPTPEQAAGVVAELRDRRLDRRPRGTTTISIWHLDARCSPQSHDRPVATPAWSAIRRNYPARTRDDLDRLHALRRPSSGGRLILWHGAPGTGKTTALRALARSWSSWCSPMYVSDPERFFANPAYIAEVVSAPVGTVIRPTLDRPSRRQRRWRLVIAEDADEYLRATARRDAGAGLGRLLNLADGVLGHGSDTLLILTTNEDLGRLHPAVARPGRALASIEFRLFEPAEARAWLGEAARPPARPVSLAELFQARGDLDPIGAAPPPPSSGHYL